MQFNPPLIEGDDLEDEETVPLDGEAGTLDDEGHGATVDRVSDDDGEPDV